MKKLFLFLTFSVVSLSGICQASNKHQSEYADFYRAEDLFDKKQYSNAIDEFSSFLEANKNSEDPIYIKARYYHGICALKLYNNNAIDVLEEFIHDYPENVFVNEIYLKIANSYFKKKSFKNSIKYYALVDDRALDTKKRSEFYFKMGYSNFEKGDRKKAKYAFEKIKDDSASYSNPALYYYSHICYSDSAYQLALNGFNRLYKHPKYKAKAANYIIQIKHKFKDYEGVVSFYKNNFNNLDDLSADLIHLTGDSYYQLGKYFEAIPFLKSYNKSSATTKDDDYALGYCYYKTNRFYEAIRLFDNLLRKKDSLAQISFYQIGDCYLELNNLLSARVAFQKAAEMQFNKVIAEDAHYNYAVISFKVDINPYNESVKAFEGYINQYPNSKRKEEVVQYLVNVYTSTSNYDKALKSIENINKKDINLKTVYQNIAYNYGVELFRKGRYNNAINAFSKSKKYPIDISIENQSKFWEAESYLRLKKLKKAISLYRSYIATPSGNTNDLKNDAYYNLAYANYELKSLDSAIVAFRLYTQSNSTNKKKMADAYLRLGDIYYMTKKDEEAVKYYQEVVNLNVGFEDQALYNMSMSYGYLDKEDLKINKLLEILSKYKNSKYALSSLFDLAYSYKSVKKDYDKSLDYFNLIIAEHPSASFIGDCEVEIADIYYKKWEYEKAEKAYLKILNKNVNNSSLCAKTVKGLMNVYSALNQPDKATALAENHACVQISDDEKENIYFNPALQNYSDSSFSEAISKFEKYLEKFPDGRYTNEALYYLGYSYNKIGDDTNSIESYKTLAKRPVNTYSEFAASKVSKNLYNNGEFEGALFYYKILENVAVKPAAVFNAQLGVMRSSVLTENYSSANEYSQKVLSNPSLSITIQKEAEYSKGISNLKLKNYDQSIPSLEWLVKNSDSEIKSEAKYHLAFIAFELNNLSESEKGIKELLKIKPSFYYWVAKGLMLQTKISINKDDLFQAEQTLNSVIDNYPDETDGIKDEANALMTELLEIKNKPKSITIEEEPTIDINENQDE